MAYATYTVNDIVKLALKDAGIIGVGQTPNAEDSNDAFTRLNWMIDQWAQKRWMIWALDDKFITATGQKSYTIGPGGQIDMELRPDRIEFAFLRQTNTTPNPIDYPLEIIESRETYSTIALKNLQSFPSWIFYNPAFPLGELFPWPVPQAAIYQVHVLVKHLLTEFASITASIVLPPQFYEALHTNLAIILRDAYDLPPKPVLIGRAKKTLSVIRNSNTAIPRLRMPAGVSRPGLYNVFSDQIR